MASQSLYRKWRSQSFAELVGQEGVVRTLLNAVRDGRLAHAYLFCGPRGTGKTSVARLLAKAINCANPHNGEPCNECISCREITAGLSPDVIEIDAASNNGIDNIRDIRQNVNLLGSDGHHRVYVIDECHMLSPQAFNALLKTLEEPPPHVIFVLATTEAHKVLATIVSRCQRFDFHRHRMADIVAHLGHVAQGEGLQLEPAAAEMIARAAQGGMRDALSLLDQAITSCGTTIDADSVRKMLGLADPASLRALIEAVRDQDTAAGLDRIHLLVAEGADPRQLSAQYSDEWRAIMLAHAGADVATIMDRTAEEAQATADLAQHFTLEQLAACARVFARNEQPARGLPVPQLALELAFLECVSICAPERPQSERDAAISVAPQPRPARDSHTASQPAPRPVAPAPPQPKQPTRPAEPVERIEHVEPAGELAEVTRMAAARPEDQAPSVDQADDEYPDDADSPLVAEAIEPAQPTESARPVPPDSGLLDMLREIQRRWAMVKKVSKQKSSMVSGLLSHAEPIQLDSGSPPLLTLAVKWPFHLEKLREPAKREAVEWALEQVFERPIRVKLVLASEGGQSGQPAARPPVQPQRPPAAPTSTSTSTAPAAQRPSASAANSAPNNIVPFPTLPAVESAPPVREAAEAPATQVAPAGLAGTAPGAASTADNAALEREVRADPVIQELMRMGATELTDVRPLTDDERS